MLYASICDLLMLDIPPKFWSFTALVIHPVQMGIASVVHLYVFPAKPYELMGECFTGDVSVLGDYVSADLSVDPDEVRDSERRTKLRLPQPDIDDRVGTAIRESVKDVFIGGGEYVSISFFLLFMFWASGISEATY